MSMNTSRAADKITQTGTLVSYSDMANPRRVGIVTAISSSPWSPFTIVWEDGSCTTSDCRQRGWQVVA